MKDNEEVDQPQKESHVTRVDARYAKYPAIKSRVLLLLLHLESFRNKQQVREQYYKLVSPCVANTRIVTTRRCDETETTASIVSETNL